MYIQNTEKRPRFIRKFYRHVLILKADITLPRKFVPAFSENILKIMC